MTSVITGDIINSRKSKPLHWLTMLKEELNQIGKSPKVWEIYRGDSFQVEVTDIHETLKWAFKIKSAIKQTKNLDVRMGIGIGTKAPGSTKITEANGEAFTHSGMAFEALKKRTLIVKSPWQDFDEEINLLLQAILLTADQWTPNSAEMVNLSIALNKAIQSELAKKLNITQGRVSERQKRAGLEELLKIDIRYRQLIDKKINHT